MVQALLGAVGNALEHRDELRYHLMRDSWSLVKRFGSRAIANIELGDVAGVRDAVVESYVDDPNRAILAALCRQAGCRTFFEIGTNRGRTAWTVARNNPDCRVYTLDLPRQDAAGTTVLGLNASDRDFFRQGWDRGEAYQGTPEEERITTLAGDSAVFDFSPYHGTMDAVFVDGAHSYEYVRNDTARALAMRAPGGLVAWDDYPRIPGVYRHLHEIAASLEEPLYHICGTRLVVLGIRALVEAGGRGFGRPLHAA